MGPSAVDRPRLVDDHAVMISRARFGLVFVLLLACDPAPTTPGTDAGTPPPSDAPLPPYSPDHTFPGITLTPPENEVQGICQSWTLNNDEPLYVHGVTFDAGEGWHHSNWVYVTEDHFEGPDGTWRCTERDFTEIAAGVVGGGAFFAQSTQSTHEEQVFPDGTAYVIPPRARIIGSVHVLNFGTEPVTTAASFHIDTLPEAEVTTILRTMAIDNRAIDLAAHASTESRTECDFATPLAAPLDFDIYYVLPHYHALATGMIVEIAGGPNDGAVIYQTDLAIGDPLGAAIDPPISLAGATGVRMRCTYENTTDTTVTYGIDAADEMCTMLAYTSGPRRLGGLAGTLTTSEPQPDGSTLNTADCAAVVAPE
jgi:hypothetical protein